MSGPDLRLSPQGEQRYAEMVAFLRDEVLPAEPAYHRHRADGGPGDHSVPPVIEELKRSAKRRGLWSIQEETGYSNYIHAFLTPGREQGLRHHWDQQ
ncbi:hypothetical protein AB0M52_26550, partial [Micromonospora sp. NPDC051296]